MAKIIVRLISALITIGTGVLFNYLFVPAWNIHSGGLWAYVFIMLIIAALNFGVGEYFLYEEEDSMPICSIAAGGLAVIVLVFLVVCAFTGSQVIHSDRYHNLIDIEQGDLTSDIVEATSKNIAVVDVGTAEKLGDRTIGTIKNASWYEVDDEYNLIEFKGKPYRISVLNYGGYFKYRKGKTTGIPGYVLVNAVTQEAKYIELENPIVYSESAYFAKDLKRHLRNEYPSYIFDSSFFEIDDNGNPYYIVSVVKPQIGVLGGKKVTSFLLVDPCTGKCKEYEPEELPSWVDHAYSISYLSNMVYYNLEYLNGYWNHLFAKTGVLKTTYSYASSEFAGYNSIVSKKDGVVFYTGLTPANVSESNVGFITANPKTGVIKRYDYAGAEESSAQAAAEGLVQNLGYKATFPNILNVDGVPTYFMVLKDNAGLIQRYSFCNIANYAEVVEAKTLEEALSLYKAKIGSQEEVPVERKENKITGTIETLYTAQIDGNTYFYYILKGSNNLFMSSIKNGNKQVVLKEGDDVTLYYSDTSEKKVCSVSKITF